MANEITPNGAKIESLNEIVENIKKGFYEIYGDGVTFESDSPDGQMINIFAQGKRDILEFAMNIYNSFDPDQAVGITLNERCALNGVIRKSATYTVLQIVVTTKPNTDITLIGLDTAREPSQAFTVSDTIGNSFYLIETRELITNNEEASNTLTFRAVNIGRVDVAINTVTNIVTPVTGVKSVNNPYTETIIGEDEESDEELRIRRAKAVGYTIAGSREVMQASLRDLEGVSEVQIFENNTDTTDSDGIPSHSIWVIIDGGEEDKIAACIYLRLNQGCGMKGSEEIDVETIYGNTQEIRFDRPIDEDLYIRFEIEKEYVSYRYSPEKLIEDFVDKYKLGINEIATVTDVNYYLKESDSNLIYTNIELSKDGQTWSNSYQAPTTKQERFKINGALDSNYVSITQPVWLHFTYSVTTPHVYDIDDIIADLIENLVINKGETLKVSDIQTELETIDNELSYSSIEISLDGLVWVNTQLTAESSQHRIVLAQDRTQATLAS